MAASHNKYGESVSDLKLAYARYLSADDQGCVHGFLAYLQHPACQVALTAQLSVETSKGFEAANPHSIPKLVNKLTVDATANKLHEAAPTLKLLAVLYGKFRDDNKDNPFFAIPEKFVPSKKVLDTCMEQYNAFIAAQVNAGKLP